MDPATQTYQQHFTEEEQQICSALYAQICSVLPEADHKIWHGHPVWFLAENPVVGYSREKKGIRLMFWSGADFDEPLLNHRGAKFKDASVYFTAPGQADEAALRRCLEKSREIQWDYKNIVKRKGKLERLK